MIDGALKVDNSSLNGESEECKNRLTHKANTSQLMNLQQK